MTVLWFSHLVKELPLAWIHENLNEVLPHENWTRSSKNWAFLAESTCGKWKLYWCFCLHSQHKQHVLAHACMCWSEHKYANRHGHDIFLLSSIWRVSASILLASSVSQFAFQNSNWELCNSILYFLSLRPLGWLCWKLTVLSYCPTHWNFSRANSLFCNPCLSFLLAEWNLLFSFFANR